MPDRKLLDDAAERHLGSLAITLLAGEQTRELGEALAQARLYYEPHPDSGLRLEVHAYLRFPPLLYRQLQQDHEDAEIRDPLGVFTDAPDEQLGSYGCLDGLAEQEGWVLRSFNVIPDDPPEDWRGQVLGAIEHQGPVNQAIVAPLPEVYPTEDRMRFRSDAERQIYKAFKRKQEAESEQKLLIAPNPAVRITGRTVEPDFLIVYQGTAGVLEIDGPGHRTRYAADASRDRLLKDHGVRHVDRIVPEDVADDLAADEIVNGFLRRLLQ